MILSKSLRSRFRVSRREAFFFYACIGAIGSLNRTWEKENHTYKPLRCKIKQIRVSYLLERFYFVWNCRFEIMTIKKSVCALDAVELKCCQSALSHYHIWWCVMYRASWLNSLWPTSYTFKYKIVVYALSAGYFISLITK